jgi:hypothetical protein
MEAHRWMFAETPSRVLLSCHPGAAEQLQDLATTAGVSCRRIGQVGGSSLDFGTFKLDLEGVEDAYEHGLSTALSATIAS